MSTARRRAARTGLQVLAAGGVAVVVFPLISGWPPVLQAAAGLGAVVTIAWAHIRLEEMGAIPTVLPLPTPAAPNPPLVQPAARAKAPRQRRRRKER